MPLSSTSSLSKTTTMPNQPSFLHSSDHTIMPPPSSPSSFKPKSHASSSIPSNFVLQKDRVDLRNPRDRGDEPFTVGHLTHLKCGNADAFITAECPNWFFNAIRLHWKVEGKILRTLQEHKDDLVDFLSLSVQSKHIIAELFTIEAESLLLDHHDSAALTALSKIMRDIYQSQWRHWTDINTRDNDFNHARLVIAHAQATANQLSNNVLAFQKGASDELKSWAEDTASRFLLKVVTHGHLPPRAFRDRAAPTHQATGRSHSSNGFPSANHRRGPGRFNRHSEANGRSYTDPLPAPLTKRKSLASESFTEPSYRVKRAKIKAEYPDDDHSIEVTRASAPADSADRQRRAYDFALRTQRIKDEIEGVNAKLASLGTASTGQYDDNHLANGSNLPLSSSNTRSFRRFRCNGKPDHEPLDDDRVAEHITVPPEEGEIYD